MHRQRVKSCTTTAACLAACIAAPSALSREHIATSGAFPHIGGNIIFRLADDTVYDAETSLDRRSVFTPGEDYFFEMVASPELHFSKHLSLRSEVRLEGVRPPVGDRFFEEEGLFVRKLFAEFAVTDRVTLHAGKITPSFALASLVTPGMYGINFSKEIELIERIGFGGTYTVDAGEAGTHTVSANTFFDDTSFLSDSIGARRGRTRLSDGGASNTESFESFTLSLEGSEITSWPGFKYKVGYIHQAAGVGDTADEHGFAIAATQSFQLDDNRSAFVFGEVAPLWNFEGSADNIVYSSAGLLYQTGPWNMILTGTHRWRQLASGGTFDDYNLQTAVKYDYRDGTSFEVAHEFIRDQDLDSRRFGVRLIKEINLYR